MTLLTDEHRMIRDMVRDFAEQELAPLAHARDVERRFPEAAIRQLAELELLGLAIPQERGGAGVDTLSFSLAIEELARVCGSAALVVATHNALGALPIQLWGSETQGREQVMRLARGEQLASFGSEDPDIGAAPRRTIGQRQGDVYRLDGAKILVPSSRHADLFVISAHDVAGQPCVFVVERGRSWLGEAAPQETLGMRSADLGRLDFDAVELPAESRLGGEAFGAAQLGALLDGGRLALSALALGLAQGAFERALRYAREREQFGKPIAEHESVQQRLADMAIDLRAARLLVYDTSRRRDAGEATPALVAMTKIVACEMAERVCDHAIQVHGGYGYILEYQIERYYRDAHMCDLMLGQGAERRLALARQLLGEVENDLPL